MMRHQDEMRTIRMTPAEIWTFPALQSCIDPVFRRLILNFDELIPFAPSFVLFVCVLILNSGPLVPFSADLILHLGSRVPIPGGSDLKSDQLVPLPGDSDLHPDPPTAVVLSGHSALAGRRSVAACRRH